MRDTERERQRLGKRKPDAGLHPRTPGSQPEPQADAQPLSHAGAPKIQFRLTSDETCQQEAQLGKVLGVPESLVMKECQRTSGG